MSKRKIPSKAQLQREAAAAREAMAARRAARAAKAAATRAARDARAAADASYRAALEADRAARRAAYAQRESARRGDSAAREALERRREASRLVSRSRGLRRTAERARADYVVHSRRELAAVLDGNKAAAEAAADAAREAQVRALDAARSSREAAERAGRVRRGEAATEPATAPPGGGGGGGGGDGATFGRTGEGGATDRATPYPSSAGAPAGATPIATWGHDDVPVSSMREKVGEYVSWETPNATYRFTVRGGPDGSTHKGLTADELGALLDEWYDEHGDVYVDVDAVCFYTGEGA